jgi:hypothetical protein
VFTGGGLHSAADAQYFGQNKVQYDTFDFRVLETEHFDIHYYPSEAEAAAKVALMAERWYTRLSKVLTHELTGRQAVVMYASHPEFEQTNVIEGLIDEATGGVTEGLRRRVVLPFAATLGETDHVLGHELVHAFQYDILGPRIGAAPLWFIEGMAEYLSTGPRSATTAMWLRDAALQGHFPAIEDLNHPRYFPYRFGHGFWAYIGGRFGDAMVGTMLHRMGFAGRAGGGGPIEVIEASTGLSAEVLSEAWYASVLNAYNLPAVERADDGSEPAEPVADGPLVIGKSTGHSGLNVGPAISPDGSKVAFLSGRGRLSIDVYVADVETGKVLHTLTETAVSPHIQSLQFISSSGAWSPDSQQLAVATVQKGRPVLSIFDVARGATSSEVRLDYPGEIIQPAWSPDGSSIAFTVQAGGHTDLFVHDLAAAATRRLTEDLFADLQPVWTPDSRSLVFVTDRYSARLETLEFGRSDLARIDVATRQMSRIDTGLSGNVHNPQFGRDPDTLFLISDATGRPEVYRFDLGGGRAVAVGTEATGISGITPLSPALSVSRSTGRAAITVFRDSGYEIRFLDPAELGADGPVQSADLDYAELPPLERAPGTVVAGLEQPKEGLPATSSFPSRGYSPKMSLLAIGQSVGLSSGGPFGTYASGGIAMLFSDQLGDHIVSATADVNGRARDVGGQLAYYNRHSRWNWSVFGGRTPLVSGSAQAGFSTVEGQLVYVEQLFLDRQTYSTVGASTAYPFSRATRFEVSVAAEHIGFSGEVETRLFDPVTGQLLAVDRVDQEGSPGLTLGRTGVALVRDSTVFGATSPVLGQRFRLEVAPTWGQLRMTNLSTDYRHYVMPVQPVTWATRLLHYGRYGASGEDGRLLPLFLGYSSLVRGYEAGSFEASECSVTPDGSCPEFDRLIGSRIIVVNTELRAPAAGLFTGDLSYGVLPIELFTFFDAGVAWTRDIDPSFAGGTRDWISSAGAGLRINAFGYLIAEINAVRPLNREGRGWMFGFNLRPGF